jgi:hypothetical protein
VQNLPIAANIFAAEDITALAAGITFMHSSQVTWLPEYGCALLALGPSDIRAPLDHVTLLLVGLDDWEFKIHTRCATWGCVRERQNPDTGTSAVNTYVVRTTRGPPLRPG